MSSAKSLTSRSLAKTGARLGISMLSNLNIKSILERKDTPMISMLHFGDSCEKSGESPVSHIIGLFNQASSQAKTTLTINLCYHLAQQGKKVLAVDMDTHAWLTKQMNVSPDEFLTTIYDVLVNQEPASIFSNDYQFDFIPANKQLSTLEAVLSQSNDRQFRLKKALMPFLKEYDYIMIDCPPNLGLLSVMCMVAVTHVLVPIETTEKGIQGAKDFLPTFQNVRQNLNKKLKLAGVIPTKYDGRRSHHKLKLETIHKSFSKAKIPVYPAIGLYTDFENAWDEAKPLAAYNSKHIAVNSLKKIAQELVDLQ